MSTPAVRTARCVVHCEGVFLLAVHQRFRWTRHRWGLPGGHVERGEDAERAVRRELVEELELEVDALVDLGRWRYRGHDHQVYGADTHSRRLQFDSSELVRIDWFRVEEVRDLHRRGRLHAGFEHDAVERLAERLAAPPPRPR